MQRSSSPEEMKRKRVASLFVFFFALFLAGALIPSKFAVTLTPSLRHRVFYLDKAPDARAIKRGGYVLFTLRDARMENGKPSNVIKEVGCTDGDTLSVRGRDYFCGGNYLGSAKELSLKGRKLGQFVFNGAVPEGMLFVYGDHKDSFDSRYFGFIGKQDVKALAYPVF